MFFSSCSFAQWNTCKTGMSGLLCIDGFISARVPLLKNSIPGASAQMRLILKTFLSNRIALAIESVWFWVLRNAQCLSKMPPK